MATTAPMTKELPLSGTGSGLMITMRISRPGSARKMLLSAERISSVTPPR
jgi:hypothetical protein